MQIPPMQTKHGVAEPQPVPEYTKNEASNKAASRRRNVSGTYGVPDFSCPELPAECEICGSDDIKNHSCGKRMVADLDGRKALHWRTYKCNACVRYYRVEQNAAPLKRRYTWRFIQKVLGMDDKRFTLEKMSLTLKKDYGLDVSPTTLHDLCTAYNTDVWD